MKEFLISILANITTDLAKNAISAIKASKTLLEEDFALKNAVGIIEMAASNGTISLSGANLVAFKSIQCDHGTGRLNIDHTNLKAPILQTGGLKSNSFGSTVITESVLEGGGSRLSVGSGGVITMTGNASIHQS